MKNKLISVIIPSYNHEKFIGKAIESVLNQTYENFELIIMDDNSTDNSKKVINSYNDSRIVKYFSTENKGAVETLNHLIDLANGEYIALLNSDDYWDLTKLEKQYRYLEENKKVAVCFTWADFVDEKGKTIYDKEEMLLDLFRKKNRSNIAWFRYFFENGNCLCHPSMMIRKEIYNEIGKYNNAFRQLPDFDMWIRIIKEYDIHILEENLTHFRILKEKAKNASFMSEKNKNVMCYEIFIIKGNFFKDCSNEFIYNAFNDKIINHNSLNNDTMMKFETCFLDYFCRYYNQVGRFLAYQHLVTLLSEPKVEKMIKKQYNFDLRKNQELAEKMVPLEVQFFDQQVIEKVPLNVEKSRSYRVSNKIYCTKFYAVTLKMRLKFRKLLGK